MNEISDDLKKNDRAISEIKSKYFPTVVSLNEPVVDEDFNDLSLVEQVSESIKYNILSLEYSISPKGGLRQWIKVNISLLLLVGIPIVIFLPLAAYLMGGLSNIAKLFTDLAEHLANATEYFFDSSVSALKTIIVLIVIGSILGIIYKYRMIFIKWVSREDEKAPSKVNTDFR